MSVLGVSGVSWESRQRLRLVLGLVFGLGMVCVALCRPARAQQNAAPQNGAPSAPAASVVPQEPGASPFLKLPQPTGEDYSKGKKAFPNLLAPYQVHNVPPAVFNNAPRLEEMIHDGKIMLSMNDAIALALADNLDIAIARYNLPIADTDILRTRSGSFNAGVSTGLVAGTPGGSGIAATSGAAGAGAGGTTVGAGGAGLGANGVVQQTLGIGPNLDSYDPILTGTLQLERAISPSTNTFITGGNAVTQQNTTVGNLQYTQGFASGSLLTVGFNNSRTATNFLTLSPQLNSSFRLTFRQHLLQGLSWDQNRRFIIIGQDQKRQTEESFRQQISFTVSQIQNIYWDLVAAYEDVKVKEHSLALAQKTLSDNKKQVEIGTMAPISIVQAESTVATDEQNLLVSQTTLQLQELYMKNAITRNLVSGSPIMVSSIVPIDTVVVPDKETPLNVEDLIQQAIANRPDFIQQRLILKDRQLSIQGANNILRPSVDVVGFYGASSLAGSVNPALICPPGTTPSRANPCVLQNGNTGFGTALGNLFNDSGPDKGVALQVNIPLRNRLAQAQQIRSQLEYRQAELNFKQSQNNLAIIIRNEAFALEQDRARILAAREAQTFAQQTLDAEQKKYNLGASTFFNVLTDQDALAQAEEATIAAEITYAKQRVTLDLDTAQTLENNNIRLAEAVTGVIKTQPNVPGLGPNTFLEQNPNPTLPSQQPSSNAPAGNPQKPPR